MRRKSNFKIFKVMKSTSKTKFSHYLLRNTLNDKFWRSYVDILYLSTMKKNRVVIVKGGVCIR